ncbi:hypothetical protein [Serratia proteamaculans]|uniref:hypothetical protein n=1 Tax=Serratia proteamaculans TaxID=28151 RepID=UPI00142F2040|nr:hypothetical protein [Serratia proteamaculans]
MITVVSTVNRYLAANEKSAGNDLPAAVPIRCPRQAKYHLINYPAQQPRVISLLNNQGDANHPRKQHLILTDAAI